MKRVSHWLVMLGWAAVVTTPAEASEPRAAIVSIERPLRLSASQPLPERRYAVGLGRLDGVQPGDVFTVYRDVPLTDTQTGELLDFLPVALGDLEIVSCGRAACTGRAVVSAEPHALPKLDYPVMMVGDRIRRKETLPFR